MRVALPEAKALLSMTFLAIFAFLIAKIATQKQQLCHAGYTYQFFVFRL